MVKRTNDPRQLELVLLCPEPVTDILEAVGPDTRDGSTEATIAEFERMARELGEHVAIEEERTGIRDVDHFAYSTFAKAARSRIGKMEEDIRAIRARVFATVPTPAFPDAGTAVSFRDTGTTILVLDPGGRLLGHVDPTQAPVLSRVLDRITRDTITTEMGDADEAGFEVVLHRLIDGDAPKKNVVRCLRHEPETRQAA